MPNLVWKTNMKVKEITITEAEVTIKPLPGAQQLSIDGKPVGQANDPAVAQQIAQATKDGKLTLNDPTKPQMGSQGAGIQEEPANSTNTITVRRGPNGLVASDGDPVMVTSTGREIDQAYLADPANAGNRVGYINFNGTKIPALNTGHKWKVGPKALQMIMANPVRESDDELARWKNIAGL